MMPLGRPSATELMDALREHLDGVLRPKLSGKEAYDLRVASNLLTILKREQEQGPAAAERAAGRLQDLLQAEGGLEELNTLLADRIRGGQIGGDNEALLAHLRQTALDRLAIDNPGHAKIQQADYIAG